MLGKSKWLSIAVVVALATIGLSASAAADSGSEQAFLSAINSTRAANGLGPLQMDGNLRAQAREHSQFMSAGNCPDGNSICHSSSAELQAAAGGGWSKLGENVGRGGSVSGLHAAFMASNAHCKNILSAYNYVGIGTTTASGVLYVTVIFMNKGGSSAEATAVCDGGPTTTTSTTAPTTTTPQTTNTTKAASQPKGPTQPEAPVTTTTTAPPTTTTTLVVGPDKPVTPGESCYTATRFGWTCHD